MKKIITRIMALLILISMPCSTALAAHISTVDFTGDMIKYTTNIRTYTWYEDQMTTGEYDSVNCGCSAATMAIKWADESFNKTGEDARNTYLSDGEGWSTSTVFKYIKDNNIMCFCFDYIYDETRMMNLLDSGAIFILCINPSYIKREASNTSYIGRYYYATGHFILVKGYVKTTTNLYLEVYDPYSNGLKNPDGTYKGEERYYTFEDINQAVKNYWEYMIIVKQWAIFK